MAEEKVLGKFVWHDLMTTDLEKAVAFYTELLPWTINEQAMEGFGTYKMIRAAGEDHGGFVQLSPEDNVPSHWIGYVTVDDVDAASARAVELGGQAPVPGMDIPGIGRFGVILDPQGAAVSPYKPNTWRGEGYEGPPRPGTFAWHELLALDPETEGRFFCEVFGWTLAEMEMGEMGTYHLFKRAGGSKDAGGMLKKPDGTAPSSWLPYVSVEDVDATAARIEPLGGRIWVQPRDIPGVGRFAVASDPTGAYFALFR
ncbi:MAG TPA: VOC family protein [Thermoanaerobaculia bacterium]